MQLQMLTKKAHYLKACKLFEQGKAWHYVPDSWKDLLMRYTSNVFHEREYKDAAFLYDITQQIERHNLIITAPEAYVVIESLAKQYIRQADNPKNLRKAVCAILRVRDDRRNLICSLFRREEPVLQGGEEPCQNN